MLFTAAMAAVTATVIIVATHLRPALAPASRSGFLPDPKIVHYRYAIAPQDDADADAAITLLEHRVHGLTPSPFDLNELAERYLTRAKLTANPKDYAASEATAQRSLQILSSPNAAVLVLAKLASTRHEFTKAIELAKRYKHGRSAGAHSVLATVYLAIGELAAASREADALIAAQPDSDGYLMRALVMQAQGRDAEAAFDFARAAVIEEAGDIQGAAYLRTMWGRFLLRRGELAGAAALIDEALRIMPGFPLALGQRGELALRTGRAKEACALFEQAFAASRQLRYLIDEARAQELAGNRAGAHALRGQIEQIVRAELTEGGLGHRLDLVEILIDRGGTADLTEATVLAREEVERRPSTDARFQLARALGFAGAHAEALAQVRAALASGAREARLYQLAAQLEQRHGNGLRAALYKRLADELDPGGSAVWPIRIGRQ